MDRAPERHPHPETHVIASFGLTARALYRLDIGRIFLAPGSRFDLAFWREQLDVTGVGTIARTPLVEIGPFLGFGVNL